MNTKKLTREDISNVIKNKEFDQKIINSAKNTAVIMTQSWCSQWNMVKNWINDLPDDPELDIFVVIYDLENYYESFMSFKENVFGNYEIPYIRYYIDGKLVDESNFIGKEGFLKKFKK